MDIVSDHAVRVGEQRIELDDDMVAVLGLLIQADGRPVLQSDLAEQLPECEDPVRAIYRLYLDLDIDGKPLLKLREPRSGNLDASRWALERGLNLTDSRSGIWPEAAQYLASAAASGTGSVHPAASAPVVPLTLAGAAAHLQRRVLPAAVLTEVRPHTRGGIPAYLSPNVIAINGVKIRMGGLRRYGFNAVAVCPGGLTSSQVAHGLGEVATSGDANTYLTNLAQRINAVAGRTVLHKTSVGGDTTRLFNVEGLNFLPADPDDDETIPGLSGFVGSIMAATEMRQPRRWGGGAIRRRTAQPAYDLPVFSDSGRPLATPLWRQPPVLRRIPDPGRDRNGGVPGRWSAVLYSSPGVPPDTSAFTTPGYVGPLSDGPHPASLPARTLPSDGLPFLFAGRSGGGLEVLESELDWRHDAACRNDAYPFFTDDEEEASARASRVKLAKAMCASCPVVAECLSYALDNEEKFGIWGGLDEAERQRFAQSGRIAG